MAGLGGLGIIGSLLQGWQQGQQNAQQQQMQRLQQQMQLQAIQRKMQEDQQAQRAQADLQKLALSGALDQTGNPLGLGMGTPAGTDQVPPQTPGPGIASAPQQTATGSSAVHAAPAPLSDAEKQFYTNNTVGFPTLFNRSSAPLQFSSRVPAGTPALPNNPFDLSLTGHLTGDTSQEPSSQPPATNPNEPGGTQTGPTGGPPGQQQPRVADVAAGLRIAGPMSKNLAVQAATQHPTQVYGGASIQQMAQAIDKIDPDAPPAVKFLALTQMQKMMAPAEKQQMQMMMLQNRQQFAEELALFKNQLSQETGPKGTPQILTDPSNNKQYIMNPAKPGSATDLQGNPYVPGGAQKMGGPSKSSSPLTDAAAERYAKIFAQTGYLPPGIARSSAAIAQIMNKTGDVGTPGEFVANLATRQADTKSLGNLTKIADAATSYENTAIRNFDQALKYKGQLATTDWGPWLNKWVVEGDKALGDPTAPAYVVALLTAANEYAKVMSGGTGAAPSTEGSRREAYELFSPYLNSGQIEQVITVAKQEMENRRQELYAGVDDVKSRLRTAGAGGPTPTGHTPGSTAPPEQQQGVIPPRPKSIPGDVPDEMVRFNPQSKLWMYFNGTDWVPAKSD